MSPSKAISLSPAKIGVEATKANPRRDVKIRFILGLSAGDQCTVVCTEGVWKALSLMGFRKYEMLSDNTDLFKIGNVIISDVNPIYGNIIVFDYTGTNMEFRILEVFSF